MKTILHETISRVTIAADSMEPIEATKDQGYVLQQILFDVDTKLFNALLEMTKSQNVQCVSHDMKIETPPILKCRVCEETIEEFQEHQIVENGVCFRRICPRCFVLPNIGEELLSSVPQAIKDQLEVDGHA